MDEGKDVRSVRWSAGEAEIVNKNLFLTAKPMIYLANLSEKDYARKSNKWLPKLAEWVKERGSKDPIIPMSVEFEMNVSTRAGCAEHVVPLTARDVVPVCRTFVLPAHGGQGC